MNVLEVNVTAVYDHITPLILSKTIDIRNGDKIEVFDSTMEG